MSQPPSGRPRGGARPGAGRPANSGPYREPTQVLRVPVSLTPQLRAWLAAHAAGAAAWPCAPQPSRRPQPLYASRVQAGFPSPADDYIEGALDLNEHLIRHPAATFFVRATGDSMLGAGIHPGDLLVVDRALHPADGRVVIAVLDGELTVKRLRLRDGRVQLVAENPAYAPITLANDAELVVWGVVTSVVHPL